MNGETKRHIDAARQVLVGVVPNPTSQIDQITNALIYKFMDDMDQAAIKAGGRPSFFVGDLEKYAWTRLMNSKIGNQERMNLYVDGFIRLSESSKIPELFRGILKSAYLPYRSPEVLDLFLREINYFDYSHPEELGNAYEHLLSIMSSQGDAGQFRTPRHIIDFIVAAVNPSKDDKILDPACGTAGFLISAYRHILSKHDSSRSEEKPLTPDQKRSLMSNFEGYDIDPGMVRISQVNMYLHQFKDPKIYQYDSLSSDERWGDKFDVILANPPFMSPKGGIRPHSRFSVQSSRSEVLFVDYIMSHLRPKGRAGIIVPEGIIFQSGTAYKQLRKNLIEDGLSAVVSLPSGVFNPYAGVKTSILFFDNDEARKKNEILFIKVGNDGFDLGATKRPIDKNDLPEALEIMSKWHMGEKSNSKIASYVLREKIAEGGDYNLSAERYSVSVDYSNVKWPMIKLGDICDITTGRKDANAANENGVYPFFTCAKDNLSINDFSFDAEALLIAGNGDVGAVKYYKGKFDAYQRTYVLTNFKDSLVKFVYYILNNSLKENLQLQKLGNTMPYIKLGMLQNYEFPLPPLDVQIQMVEELDNYQKIITGAQQVVDNWKPRIDIDPEWERVKLGEVSEVEYGIGEAAADRGEYRYIRITDIDNNGQLRQDIEKKYIAESIESKKYLLKRGDVLVARTGATFGKTLYFDEPELSAFAGFLMRIKFNRKIVLPKYFWCFAQTDLYWSQANSLMTGGGQPQFNAGAIKSIVIPVPSLDVQDKIIHAIDFEKSLVNSSKSLIDIYFKKIEDVVEKLW